jgi:hypothetical protein
MSEEPILREPLEIPVVFRIDMEDESELTPDTAAYLRKCVAGDAEALEELAMAFIMRSPAAITMSCSGEADAALQELTERRAVRGDQTPAVMVAAAEARMKREYDKHCKGHGEEPLP